MPASYPVTVDVAKPRDLPWIADLERKHYGPMRAVAKLRIHEWYAANPSSLLVLREGARRVGHATLLPLRPAAMDALIDGSMGEDQIEGKDIFGAHERLDVRTIYIESVIAQPLSLLAELVRTFDVHVSRLADPDLLEAIYLCPLTEAGRLAATNLRFESVARNSPMYRVECAKLVARTAALRKKLEAMVAGCA